MNNLILCGFKYSGKTTLGKIIAKRKEWSFIDTDTLLKENFSKIYREKGDIEFRKQESEIVASLINHRNSVIATGGGGVLNPHNVSILKTLGKIAYLYVEKEELKKRFFSHPLPSFLDASNPLDSFEKMYQSRISIYSKIADYTIYNEDQLWEVMHLDPFFASLHGENLMA